MRSLAKVKLHVFSEISGFLIFLLGMALLLTEALLHRAYRWQLPTRSNSSLPACAAPASALADSSHAWKPWNGSRPYHGA